MTNEQNHEERGQMQEAVRLREQRRRLWQEEGERPLWKNLAMVGALGWLIVVPTVCGVFVGRWLDARLGTGALFGSALTFLGAAFGFFFAWRRMNET